MSSELAREFYALPDEDKLDLRANFEAFLEHLEARRRRRQPVVLIIDGRETGVGKSTLGIQICRRLDPAFGLERVIYSARELHDAYAKDPAGAMVLYDESVLGLLSKKGSRDEELSGIISALSIVRKNGIGTVLTIPKIRMLDSIVYNGLAPFWLFIEERGRARVHRAHKGARYRNSQRIIPYDRWWSVSPIGWRSLDRDPFFRAYSARAIERNREYFLEQQEILDAKRRRLLGGGGRAAERDSTGDTGTDRSNQSRPPPPPRPRCAVCGRDFSRADLLRRHEDSVHRDRGV